MKIISAKNTVLILALATVLLVAGYVAFFSEESSHHMSRYYYLYETQNALSTKLNVTENQENKSINHDEHNHPQKYSNVNNAFTLKPKEDIREEDTIDLDETKNGGDKDVAENKIEKVDQEEKKGNRGGRLSINDLVQTPFAVYEYLKNSTDFSVTLDIHDPDVPEIYKQRRQHVYDMCRKYRREGSMRSINIWPKMADTQTRFFFFSNETKLIGRLVPKCGHTYLTGYFKTIGDNGNYRRTMYEMKTRISLLKYWNYLHKDEGFMSFIVTRHPLSRLLSVYRNKLESSTEYRTIPEYHVRSRIIYSFYNNGSRTGFCTFSEFIQALIDSKIMNVHWNPLHSMVHPCDLTYTIYGRLETLKDDMEYIARRRNISEEEIKHSYNQGPPSNTKKYYGTITKTQLTQLIQKYKKDFELYGYDYDEYFSYVKDE